MAARTIQELSRDLQSDPQLEQEIKTNPKATLEREARAFTGDQKFYRIAIVGLITIILVVVVSAIVVQIWKGENLSDWISALATTALGGLVGLFAPSPSEK